MAKVEDDPAKGYLAKLICSRKCVDFTYFPQLGLPKVDRDDPIPQFDEQRKIRYTFSSLLLGNMLAVLMGYSACAEESERGQTFRFTKEDESYRIRLTCTNAFTGDVIQREVVFCDVYAIGLKHYLRAALPWILA